jgi:hypothetical protein
MKLYSILWMGQEVQDLQWADIVRFVERNGCPPESPVLVMLEFDWSTFARESKRRSIQEKKMHPGVHPSFGQYVVDSPSESEKHHAGKHPALIFLNVALALVKIFNKQAGP